MLKGWRQHFSKLLQLSLLPVKVHSANLHMTCVHHHHQFYPALLFHSTTIILVTNRSIIVLLQLHNSSTLGNNLYAGRPSESALKVEFPSVNSKSSAGSFLFTPTSEPPPVSQRDPNPCTAPESSSSEGHFPTNEPRILDDTGDTGMLMDFCMGFLHGWEKVSQDGESELLALLGKGPNPMPPGNRPVAPPGPVRTLTPLAHLLELELQTLANSRAVLGESSDSPSSTGVRAPSGVSQYPGRRWDWLEAAAAAATAAAARKGWWVHAVTAWENAFVVHSGRPSLPIASQSGFTGMPLAVGELKGGVTGALEEPPCIACKGGRPVLLLVLAVPLPPPPPADDNPFNQGIRDVPSLAPG